MNQEPTTTGTVEDVASFFRVSVRTVAAWKAEHPPRLAYWQEGRNICFGEEAIIRLRVERMSLTDKSQLGLAEQTARKEWRAHLQVRAEFTELSERVARLEALVQPQNSLAA